MGWYENAKVYRYRKRFDDNNVNKYGYNFKTKKDNAFLIPENNRDFFVKRARKDGIGFGQSNVWYPMKHTSKNGLFKYIDNVVNYLNNIKLNIHN